MGNITARNAELVLRLQVDEDGALITTLGETDGPLCFFQDVPVMRVVVETAEGSKFSLEADESAGLQAHYMPGGGVGIDVFRYVASKLEDGY